MKREKLMVAAIENGTVIDHIPSEKLFAVIRLLHIEELDHEHGVYRLQPAQPFDAAQEHREDRQPLFLRIGIESALGGGAECDVEHHSRLRGGGKAPCGDAG